MAPKEISMSDIAAMQTGEWEENMGFHWGALKMDEVNPPKRQRLQVYC